MTSTGTHTRPLLIGLMVCLGLALAGWTRLPVDQTRPIDLFVVGGLAITAAVLISPLLRRRGMALLERVESANPRYVAAVLFLLAFVELTYSGLRSQPYLLPKSHDEQSYYLGALQLSTFRLWAWPPPSPEHFESFHMISSPVYASVYFPGTALMFTPAVWLDVPVWVWAVLISSLTVVVGYLLLRAVVGGGLAMVGSLFLIASPQFRSTSLSILSQIPSLLAGMLTLLAVYGYTTSPGKLRLALAVAAGCLHVLIRPQDAVATLAAAVVLLVLNWRTWRHLPVTARPRFRSHAPALLVCVPFIGIQLMQNVGLTGSPWTNPYAAYMKAMHPGIGFFTSPGSSEISKRPETTLAQKRDYLAGLAASSSRELSAGYIREFTHRRMVATLRRHLVLFVVIALVPLGVVGLWQTSLGKAMLMQLAMSALVYGGYSLFLPHYSVAFGLYVSALAVAAPVGLARLAPGAFPAARLGVFLLVAVALLSTLPEINPIARDGQMDFTPLRQADQIEASLAMRPNPSLLLFTYGPNADPRRDISYQYEPVYNIKTPELMGHKVLRAHDLGPEKNRELFRGLKDSNREVFIYQRATKRLIALGLISALAGETGSGSTTLESLLPPPSGPVGP